MCFSSVRMLCFKKEYVYIVLRFFDMNVDLYKNEAETTLQYVCTSNEIHTRVTPSVF